MAACVSVIVATYNRYDALDAVLRGLSKQTDRDFEVVVADDGSGPSTARVIGEWQRHFADRLIHVWQPDEGFRLAEIRNRAVGKSAGDYLVFLDGDCIPLGDFVAPHDSGCPAIDHLSGTGMNSSVSPVGSEKRPCSQSPAAHAALAASIFSWLEATKFHQI